MANCFVEYLSVLLKYFVSVVLCSLWKLKGETLLEFRSTFSIVGLALVVVLFNFNCEGDGRGEKHRECS